MRNTPRLLSTAALVMMFGGIGCSNPARPTAPDPAPVDPGFEVVTFGIKSVQIEIVPGSQPRAIAHVTATFSDSCGSIGGARQVRSGKALAVTLIGQRPTHAICLQVITDRTTAVTLEGTFPRGNYVVTINSVATSFSVP